MTLQWTIPTIALAACMSTAAAASEITWYKARDLPPCSGPTLPDECWGMIKGLALDGAWSDNRVSCVLDEQNPLTLAELRARVDILFDRPISGDPLARDYLVDILATAVDCDGHRSRMATGIDPG